jgi:hypothetical protein
MAPVKRLIDAYKYLDAFALTRDDGDCRCDAEEKYAWPLFHS